MQELRLVAVSEDGSYAILAVPGRSGRFLLPIDDRLRTVAKGQFSRLAQYEIEVENPLRPKEIQDRIRAGETADEIADAAGIPPERIRRFEGPILAERQYQAEQARRATIRGHGDSGPGPRLGDIVTERLALAGAGNEGAEWDSRKRPDGNWQVQLQFSLGSRTASAEWIYDPRRRHVIPDDDQAVRLCLPQAEWNAVQFSDRGQRATVTPIGSRHAAREPEIIASPAPLAREAGAARTGAPVLGGSSVRDGAAFAGSAASAGDVPRADPRSRPAQAAEALVPAADERSRPAEPAEPAETEPAQPARKAAGSRARRSSVPSWDEIMFGTSRQPD
jgi:Protein of unknown function (DUF3071)